MIRIGSGYDIHRLVPGRPLIIGGVTIPFPRGCEAHSDGDVLLHALIDALLGALALGDIGTHFPPEDPQWKDADSRDLLRRTVALVQAQRFMPVNLDATIILQEPKLKPHTGEMRRIVGGELGLSTDFVSIKAKTKERQDAAGQGLAVEAWVSILLSGEKHDGKL